MTDLRAELMAVLAVDGIGGYSLVTLGKQADAVLDWLNTRDKPTWDPKQIVCDFCKHLPRCDGSAPSCPGPVRTAPVSPDKPRTAWCPVTGKDCDCTGDGMCCRLHHTDGRKCAPDCCGPVAAPVSENAAGALADFILADAELRGDKPCKHCGHYHQRLCLTDNPHLDCDCPGRAPVSEGTTT